MVLREVEQIQNGLYKITPDAGASFFLRKEYMSLFGEEILVPVQVPVSTSDTLFLPAEELTPGKPGVLTDEQAEEVLYASLVYAAEVAAMSYLARAEQCRSGLLKKLLSKGIEAQYANRAFDYLEEIGYLSDFRFACAWLRTRAIDHAEGRKKLEAELYSRGINREDTKKALDEFFSEFNEGELCSRALRKIRRTRGNLEEEKIYASLLRYGFPSKIIKSVLAE